VWSYGHRNPQGLAWDDEGGLWSTEHGRSGAFSGYDELNIIEPGGNYGWPVIEGSRTGKGMMAPVINSGADYTWAPAGMAYFEGRIFFAGLRGEALYEYDIESGMIKNHFFGEYGRLRAVTIGPDGFMYISTSNRDGRGDVRSGDDRIIGINMRVFSE
jgi:glucose/arabinose dehydrogenase